MRWEDQKGRIPALPLVGMARCAVPARASGRNEGVESYIGRDSFRRLRSATGPAQRAQPYLRCAGTAQHATPTRSLVCFEGIHKLRPRARVKLAGSANQHPPISENLLFPSLCCAFLGIGCF